MKFSKLCRRMAKELGVVPSFALGKLITEEAQFKSSSLIHVTLRDMEEAGYKITRSDDLLWEVEEPSPDKQQEILEATERLEELRLHADGVIAEMESLMRFIGEGE